MRWDARTRAGMLAAAVLSCVVASGCAGRHRLTSGDLTGRSVAVIHVVPQVGELRFDASGPADGPTNALAAAPAGLDAGPAAFRERLDSAARRVSIGSRLAERTAMLAMEQLGARRVVAPSAADYVMDLRVRSFGVSAHRGDPSVHLFLEADVVLIDAATGAHVWTTRVSGWDTVPSPAGGWTGLESVATIDIERTLLRVVDVSADAVAEDLRSRLGMK